MRHTMRQRRNALPVQRRAASAMSLRKRLEQVIAVRPGLRIAVYVARDGEIDPTPFARLARRNGCRLFAPVIVDMRNRMMEFVPLPTGAGTSFESKVAPHVRCSPRSLDVVLAPLIAFDCGGWRLGYGAGFYDRKFAFRRTLRSAKPLLLGVGYAFQRVPRQTPQRWDVLLDAVVTERGVVRCRRASATVLS